MNPSLITDAINKLMEMFRSGDFPAKTAYTIIRRHSGDIRPSDNWSLGNRLLMLANGTDMAAGFKQWQLLNRRVKIGAKAFYIAVPIIKPVKQLEGMAESDKPLPLVVGFRFSPVFKVEDTVPIDGKELPLCDYTPPLLPPLFDVAEKLGIKVSYQPFNGHALGSYSSSTLQIKLSAQDAFVYFHELAHHIDNQIEAIRPGRLAVAEIVAEMSASTLSALQGITGYESSAYNYICYYAKDKKLEAVLQAIMSVAARVEQIVTIVLEAAETQTVSMSSVQIPA